VEIKARSMISCLWRVRYVLLCCVLDIQVTSMLTPNLVTTFALLSPLSTMLVHTTNFWATWNFSLSVWSIMVSWAVANGSATKPRASCGRPTQGCAAPHALVSRFLVVIHYGTIPMKCLLVTFPRKSHHIISKYPYIHLDVVGHSSGVNQRLTFEEQVTDIKTNRLQEMVDKWQYFTILAMIMIV